MSGLLSKANAAEETVENEAKGEVTTEPETDSVPVETPEQTVENQTEQTDDPQVATAELSEAVEEENEDNFFPGPSMILTIFCFLISSLVYSKNK